MARIPISQPNYFEHKTQKKDSKQLWIIVFSSFSTFYINKSFPSYQILNTYSISLPTT